jgi:hypothetical protein
MGSTECVDICRTVNMFVFSADIIITSDNKLRKMEKILGESDNKM